MNYAKHARELIDSSKAWLASAELDTDERKWKKANVALAKDYLRLRAENAKLRAACRRIAALCEFPEAEARDALAETAP